MPLNHNNLNFVVIDCLSRMSEKERGRYSIHFLYSTVYIYFQNKNLELICCGVSATMIFNYSQKLQ